MNEILPAVGQGIIAVQCRRDDELIKNIIKKINDTKTSLCAIAERKMLKTIGGDCETAIGGLAEITNDNLTLKHNYFQMKVMKVLNIILVDTILMQLSLVKLLEKNY